MVFDRNILRRKRQRILGALNEYRFLLDWTGAQLLERFDDIKRDFPVALQIGGRDTADFKQALQQKSGAAFLTQMDLISGDVIGDEECLPFANESLDLVVSNLSLHSTNDLPGALIQIRRALKPDGLFIAAMLGGETLRELRESLMQAEMDLKGGVSPRVAPFADKQQMGGLLQRAGLALPVVDSDIISVTYPDIYKLMRDLRGMGESNIIDARSKHFTSRALFEKAAEYYTQNFAEEGGRLVASFEVIFLLGWAPHESQQKPLKPGSAQARLADALATEETKL